MEFLFQYFKEFINILNEMSPYLLLGFLFAGILHVFFPKDKVDKFLGKKNYRSVFNAALLGVPLPLCSCGVIPTGISFYKNGASKGSSVSFLISTPQTGVDSILVTYSLLGLPFAILRPFIALVTGFIGGVLTNIGDKERDPKVDTPKVKESDVACDGGSCCDDKSPKKNSFLEMFHYAFVEFLQDISKWLIIGLIMAAVISVAIPESFFTTYLSNDYLSMLIVLLASIPLYVCATSSVPIAAILIMKGISPGAALVFLMAGPATNAATMTVIGKVLGKKTLLIYLFSIITGALLFGTLINFLPRELFLLGGVESMGSMAGHEAHGILPLWFKTASSVTLILLIANGYLQKYLQSEKITQSQQVVKVSNSIKVRNISNSFNVAKIQPLKKSVEEIAITVNGMTCNHCKSSVEKNLSSLEGVESVTVDLTKSMAAIKGKNVDLEKIRETLDNLGYEYAGKIEL